MSTTTVTFDVTQEHIDAGEPCRSQRCPVALAVKDAIKDCDAVSVAVDYVFIVKDPWTHGVFYPATKELERFIRRFDSYKTVKPQRFQLRAGGLGG